VDAPDSYSRMKSKNSASVEDERTASKLMHIGRLLDAQRRYTEAESFLTQAFGIEKALHGIDHPHTGTTLIKLGLHDYVQGRSASGVRASLAAQDQQRKGSKRRGAADERGAPRGSRALRCGVLAEQGPRRSETASPVCG